MTYKIGDLYPVWWSTGITEDEWNYAYILAIRPYVGPYEKEFKYILRLSAPSTKRGWVEMTVP